MVFNSMLFMMVFLPVSFLAYYAVSDKWKNLVLAFASIVFFAWGEPIFIFALLVSLIVNYITGRSISESEGFPKKVVLIVSVVFNLGVLVFFRYCAFVLLSIREFISSFWVGLGDFVPVIDSISPFGIAVFTLLALSYNIDIYRGEQPRTRFVDAVVAMCFFPAVVMGPVVKYRNMSPMISNRTVSINGIARGLVRFALGFVKVVLVAKNMDIISETIFGYAKTYISFSIAWNGVLCNAVALVYEMTGYADMAIGLGKIFGFDLPEDFKNPLGAHSLTDFWTNRWRINLSAWFREYLYIPMGGNRKKGSNLESNFFTYVNMGITILLYMIWYTTDWYLIGIGILFGIIMIIEKAVTLHNEMPRNKYETGMTKEEQYRAWLVYKYGKDQAVYMEKKRLFINRHIKPVFSVVYSLLVLNLANIYIGSGSLAKMWVMIKAMLGFGYINTKTSIAEIFGNECFVIYVVSLILMLPFIPWVFEKVRSFLKEKASWIIPVARTVGVLVLVFLTVWSIISLAGQGTDNFVFFR